jgi:spore germination protein GerM
VAQIEQTVRQFPDVASVAVFINGKPIEELLSGRGQELTPTGVPGQLTKIFLIALEDAGKSGPAVGCGDSVVGVDTGLSPAANPTDALHSALESLLSAGDKYASSAGLYNALKTASLNIDSAVIENGNATVQLSGILQLGGECDNPRVEAQLVQTVQQFVPTGQANIFLNGKPLKEALSLR